MVKVTNSVIKIKFSVRGSCIYVTPFYGLIYNYPFKIFFDEDVMIQNMVWF